MSASTDGTAARAGLDGADFRRPTMRDVAARAGVSLKTVSRVVNAEAGVSPALVEKVQRAVAELDFRPNVGASSLRRADGKTATVGLLVEDVAMRRGVVVFSASLDEDPARERELARAFAARRADGLILVPASDDQSYLEPEVRAGTAVVCVDRACHGVDVDSVVATNRSGSAEGVRHLLAGGHRRVAFLGDRQAIWTARERYEGYLDALRSAGVDVDPSIVVHDLTDTGVADGATSTLLTRPNPPTALFTAQNLVTIGALRAMRRLGVERSIALVGFDDFPLADLVTPGVTVVAQDPTAIGKLAASVLFSRLAGDTSPTTTHVVPTTLVRRGSGEIPPPR